MNVVFFMLLAAVMKYILIFILVKVIPHEGGGV